MEPGGVARLKCAGQQGRMTSLTYPSGPSIAYTYDQLNRVTGWSQTNGGMGLSAYATWGSGNQLLTFGGSGVTGTSQYDSPIGSSVGETLTYNNMLQLVHVVGSAWNSWSQGYYQPTGSASGRIDVQYIFAAGHNNGRLTQTIDNVLGETVNYAYDYLHRLTAATATNGSWGNSYSYDGFGNLTAKTPTQGSAPSYGSSGSSSTDAPGLVDANGLLTAYQWDVENRPVTQNTSNYYVYDPWGRRVWWQYQSQSGTNCEAYFYGATGQKLESYSWAKTLIVGPRPLGKTMNEFGSR